MTSAAQQSHQLWLKKVATAEAMIPLIGRLYREHNVIAHVHGRSLVNLSAIDVIKAHRWARKINEVELDVELSLTALQLAAAEGIENVSLDLGTVVDAAPVDEAPGDVEAYLRDALATLAPTPRAEPRDVVLYGFGRIGRILARILIAHAGDGLGLRLRAIVVRPGRNGDVDIEDLRKRAALLRRDSVHGAFKGAIEIDDDSRTILANGTLIQLIAASDPASVDYEQYGIRDAIVVDNTGIWRDEAGLSKHLEAGGVRRVLLTAPGKGDLPNVVFGINHETVSASDAIVSAASCTTNAITPVLQVVNEAWGIEHGHVETVHSFTNDQNLIDNVHKGPRRGRSAALNMVLTETGAAKAVAKALPELAGKLTGNSIRVPTPNVSMAVIHLTLEHDVDRETVNRVLREMSLTGRLRAQIDYIESPDVVSSDFVGSNRAGIVDGLATIASGKHLVLYVWYDNEFGYSSQVVRVLEHLALQATPAAESARLGAEQADDAVLTAG